MNSVTNQFKLVLSILSLLALSIPTFAVVHQVSAGSVSDHADASNSLSIQYAIDHASPGDVIELVSNSSYVLKKSLILDSKLTLKGRRFVQGFELQKVIADPSFVSDVSMITIHGGEVGNPTKVESVRFDAKNSAWRIVQTTKHENYYTFTNCRLENTKNEFTKPDSVGYESPYLKSPYYDVSLMICRESDHVTVHDCYFLTAGLNWYEGKKNPEGWKGFGSGIKFYNCDNIEVTDSKIERTLTEGIRLWGCQNVLIDNNEIVRTALNNEWYTIANVNNRGYVASAITGYHNQPAFGSCGVNHNWIISNNRFFWNANNALSLSGKGIEVFGNRANYTYQNALFLGDWRTCDNGAGEGYDNECVRNVNVYDNDFDNSYHDFNSSGWVYNVPDGLSQSTAAPHADIRVNGYDGSVNICNNINVTITYETDKTDCGCVCPPQSPQQENGVTSSVESIQNIDELEVKIYPNPVDNELNIELGPTVETGYLHLSISDVNGRIAFEKEFKGIQGTLQIPTKHLAPGVYMLNLKNSKENKSIRFIKE